MTNKLKFIWIDDDDREKSAKNLEKQLGVKCVFVHVKPQNVKFLSIIEDEKPNLILVDHNLINIGSGDMKKGSTLAALIREKHPTYPIACVTGQVPASIDSQQRSSYESIFEFNNIKDYYDTMKSIAFGYKKLKDKSPKTVQELLALIKVPKDDKIKLESVLPYEIKDNLKDKSLSSSLSHWIRDILIGRPGFLYDRLWVATFLGLNENGFAKVELFFSAALYKGIFVDQSKTRWWKSEVVRILNNLVKVPGLPWERGRALSGINSHNHSKDYYSDYKEDLPEVVAYIDDTSDERAQMKIKHTVEHPRYEKLLFFEDIRMMKTTD